MYLITGGSGKIGALIRSSIEDLLDADSFDIKDDKAHNILDETAIAQAIRSNQHTVIIHLAEASQPSHANRYLYRDVFDRNVRGTKNLLNVLRNYPTKLVYTVDMNSSRGVYNRSKRLNQQRISVHLENSFILPLPEVLPKETTKGSVTPTDLLTLVEKFATIDETGSYRMVHAPKDFIYLGTEDHIVSAFESLITDLETLNSGHIENDKVITIQANNFVGMIKRHFPDISIVLSPDREGRMISSEIPVPVEQGVEELEEYFKSLSISALYSNF